MKNLGYCAECEYSYSTSTSATTIRRTYPLCKQCAADWDQSSSAHLRSVILRLKREIEGLKRKPAPVSADYAQERFFKKALTTRQSAIRRREKQIKEYQSRLQVKKIIG